MASFSHNFLIYHFYSLFPVLSPIIFIVTATILGFITPEYNQINHTLSRLVIERYGWIQILNLFQLGLGIYLTSLNLEKRTTHYSFKAKLRTIFYIPLLILLLVTIIPTDPIENQKFSFSIFTPLGLTHLVLVFLFLVLSPFGIYKLINIFKSEKKLNRFSRFTAFMGYSAFFMSAIWLTFYVLGVFLEYRGLFQKIIVAWTFFWFLFINLKIYENN